MKFNFNSNKFKILHVGENNPAVLYYIMDANELESSGVEKDLGVLVDNKLKFDHHMNETIKKSNKMVAMIMVMVGMTDFSCTSSLFTLNLSSGTRAHPYKLIKPSVNSNRYSHFFTNRIINNLPCNIVTAGMLYNYIYIYTV